MTGLDLLELLDQRKVHRLAGNEKSVNPDLETKGTKSIPNSVTAFNMAGCLQLRQQVSSSHQVPKKPSPFQPTAGGVLQKSLRHHKNIPLSQFPPADLQCLRRELQRENLK